MRVSTPVPFQHAFRSSQVSGLDSLCAFADIVPHTFQSGGPDQPAARVTPRLGATTSSKTGRSKALKKSFSTTRPNSRIASPVGMPTASTASLPVLVATCAFFARLSSIRFSISTPQAAPAQPPMMSAPTLPFGLGSSSSANGAPFPEDSPSLATNQLLWAFGGAPPWSRVMSSFP